jgi:hypothetical protein
MMGEGSYKQLTFHEGKVIADADARAGSKGDVGVARELFLSFWREVLGIERFRVREVFGFAV